MRKSKLSSQEIAEMDEMNKKQTRNSGYALMSVRDRGWSKLDNGSVVHWHIKTPLQEGVPRQVVPDGYCLIDGKLFDAEQLKRVLRWA